VTLVFFRCDLRIVSDANTFFIETILKHLGIREYFSEINTNPGYVNEEGRLRILPYHDFNKASHGCSLCPPNMCKVNTENLFFYDEIFVFLSHPTCLIFCQNHAENWNFRFSLNVYISWQQFTFLDIVFKLISTGYSLWDSIVSIFNHKKMAANVTQCVHESWTDPITLEWMCLLISCP